jgi:hypothetical protein
MGLGRREQTGHTTSRFVGLRFKVQSSEVRGYGLGLALLRGHNLAFHCLKPCAGRGSSFQGLIPAIAQARAHHGPPESATRKAAGLGARGAGSDAGCRVWPSNSSSMGSAAVASPAKHGAGRVRRDGGAHSPLSAHLPLR